MKSKKRKGPVKNNMFGTEGEKYDVSYMIWCAIFSSDMKPIDFESKFFNPFRCLLAIILMSDTLANIGKMSIKTTFGIIRKIKSKIGIPNKSLKKPSRIIIVSRVIVTMIIWRKMFITIKAFCIRGTTPAPFIEYSSPHCYPSQHPHHNPNRGSYHNKYKDYRHTMEMAFSCLIKQFVRLLNENSTKFRIVLNKSIL